MLMYSFEVATLLFTFAFFFCVFLTKRKLRNTLCSLVGCILGGFISAPMFQNGKTAGFIGMGIGMGISFLLFYTPLFPWLIGLIPENFKKIVKNIFKVSGIIFITIAIAIAVIVFLSFLI